MFEGHAQRNKRLLYIILLVTSCIKLMEVWLPGSATRKLHSTGLTATRAIFLWLIFLLALYSCLAFCRNLVRARVAWSRGACYGHLLLFGTFLSGLLQTFATAGIQLNLLSLVHRPAAEETSLNPPGCFLRINGCFPGSCHIIAGRVVLI